MIQHLSFSEMNHAVPGSSFSPRMDRYLECEVPSPSQWSDPCRSPPSLNSPTNPTPVDLEKLKEEPPSPTSFPHSPSHHVNRPMNREGLESSINLAQLLEENITLVSQFRDPQPPPTQRPQASIRAGGTFGPFESLLDIKSEVQEEVVVGAKHFIFNCSTSPGISTSPTGNGEVLCLAPLALQPPVSCGLGTSSHVGSIGDSLRTVELMVLDHCWQDVQRVSHKLNIPKDPIAWSAANVRSWLEFEAEQQGLSPPILGTWSWTGRDLIRLTEAQFRELIPNGGELLYAKLEIWREALRTSQIKPNVMGPTQPSLNDSLHTQYDQPIATTPITETNQQQPLFVDIQPQTSPQYQHQASRGYPPPYSSAFSPSNLMMSPSYPPPLHSDLSSSHLHSLYISPNSSLQIPTPVVQADQQKHKQQPQKGCPENAPSNPSSPSASVGQPQSLPQQIQNPFMEKCIDMTTLLQPAPESSSGGKSSRIKASQDDADSEDEADKGLPTGSGSRGGTHIHLWQFLKELLMHPQLYGSCIRWLDRSKGVFKIEDSVRVARLWGKRKNRPAMNYDKLSRSIRQYYKKGIMKKTERSQRLVYQFCHPYSL